MRQLIDSPHNKHVRQFRALATKKGRAKYGLVQVEGVRLVQEALAAGVDIAWVAICPYRLKGFRARQVLDEIQQRNVPVLSMTQRAFTAMSDTIGPQGIAAACRLTQRRLDDLASVLAPPTAAAAGRRLVLALYELRDPGNMGTMIRTANAFGCAAVVAIGDCVDFFNPKVIRASAGGVFHLPLVSSAWDQFRAWAARNDITVLAAVTSGGVPCTQLALPAGGGALVMGSEAHGLPDVVLTAADITVTIPMAGAAESLNAAVAAGIILYEINKGSDRVK